MISSELKQLLEDRLSIDIQNARSVTGGDINDAFTITSSKGQTFFVKGNGIEEAPDMLSTEALGLQTMSASGTVPVPEVIDLGILGTYAFLVLEFIEPGNLVAESWDEFAQNLSGMHRSGGFPFGLDHDNFIGRLHQRNGYHESWSDFYRAKRLQPQLAQMKRNFPGETRFYQDAEKLLSKLGEIVEDAEPSMIHGDMWGGNHLVSRKGLIYLIDPAVSIASREMDIAMSLLFGGYPEHFYHAYHQHYPLQSGWEGRIPVYQLYYLLVHVNLFGRSYMPGAHRAIRKYL